MPVLVHVNLLSGFEGHDAEPGNLVVPYECSVRAWWALESRYGRAADASALAVTFVRHSPLSRLGSGKHSGKQLNGMYRNEPETADMRIIPYFLLFSTLRNVPE